VLAPTLGTESSLTVKLSCKCALVSTVITAQLTQAIDVAEDSGEECCKTNSWPGAASSSAGSSCTALVLADYYVHISFMPRVFIS
jgi:hypothetical protein